MTWTVELGVEDMAGTRFAISPVHETISAVQLLTAPDRQPVHAPWSVWARRQVAVEPVSMPLVEQLVAHDRPSWPEFLAPAPASREAGLDDQLAALCATDAAKVRTSIRRVFGNDPPAAAVRLSADPGGTLTAVADELRAAHDRLIAPHWPRMHALLDVDIEHRARLLAASGPAGLLGALHPTVRWRSGVLTITRGRRHRPLVLGAGGLVLCPSVFGGPHVTLKGHTSSQTTLRYPARGLGLLWAAPSTPPPESLVRLVGRARARLLSALASPATTTMLAHEQGVTASAVSQHLAVLLANDLVTRDRVGRQVHYRLTDAGRALVGRVSPVWGPQAAAPSRRSRAADSTAGASTPAIRA